MTRRVKKAGIQRPPPKNDPPLDPDAVWKLVQARLEGRVDWRGLTVAAAVRSLADSDLCSVAIEASGKSVAQYARTVLMRDHRPLRRWLKGLMPMSPHVRNELRVHLTALLWEVQQ
jgi:hypothetical protein